MRSPASRSMRAGTATPARRAEDRRIFKWPGAIHEGNGEALAFVDERADEPQRDALLKIMTGQDTDPFATMFAVLRIDHRPTMHEPVFTAIDFEVDVDGRRGRLVGPWLCRDDRRAAPQQSDRRRESRAQIVLPDGFEYEVADIGSASSRTTGGPMELEIDSKYGTVREPASFQPRCRPRLT